MEKRVISSFFILVAILCLVGNICQSFTFGNTLSDISSKYNQLMLSLQPELVERDMPYKKLGRFELTWYCPCEKCVGKKKEVRTYTGTKPKAGRTLAVDPNIVPLGSILYVQGYGYFIAEDIGSAIKGNHVDIYVDSHREALQNGKKIANIYLLK